MVMPVGAMKVTCPHCGWMGVYQQASDVIHVPSECKKCGTGDLALGRPTLAERVATLDGALSDIRHFLGEMKNKKF